MEQKKRERVQNEKELIKKEIEEKILKGEMSPGEVTQRNLMQDIFLNIQACIYEMVKTRNNQDMTVADILVS